MVYTETTKLYIKTDKMIKEQTESIFNEPGLNRITISTIEEGRKLMEDSATPRYSNMDDLKAALDI